MSGAKGFGGRVAQERREKSAREHRDIGQKDVAKVIGATAPTVSRWEAGLVMPGDEMIERLAAYFGVTPAWLRYGQEPREAPVNLAPVHNVEPERVRPAVSSVTAKRKRGAR